MHALPPKTIEVFKTNNSSSSPPRTLFGSGEVGWRRSPASVIALRIGIRPLPLLPSSVHKLKRSSPPSPPLPCTVRLTSPLVALPPLSKQQQQTSATAHLLPKRCTERKRERTSGTKPPPPKQPAPPPSSHSFLSRAFARIVNAIFLVCTRLLPSSLRRWRYRISGRGCGVFSFPGE